MSHLLRSQLRRPSSQFPSPQLTLADPGATRKTLTLLLRSRNLRPALDFLLSLPHPSPLLRNSQFNSFIRSLARAGHLRRAVQLFRLMPIRGVPYSPFSFNSLLSALLRRGRTRSASRLFAYMLHLHVPPDVVTFNTLIRGFCLNNMFPEVFRLLGFMFRSNCYPDVVTFNTILDGFVRLGEFGHARKLFDEMRRGIFGVLANVVSYTIVIRGCFRRFRVDEAVFLLDEMGNVGLNPNRVTFNVVIKGFCEAGRFDLVKKFLDKDGIFTPDVCTFNTLIAAHCNAGDLEGALKVFDRLTEFGVKGDSATYSTVIRGLCSVGEFERAEMLVDMIHEKKIFKRSDSCRPLMAAYNPMLEYLCRCGKAKKAGRFLGEMLERRSRVDIVAFNTVIFGYCKEGKFFKGYNLLVSMLMRDLKPGYELCEELVKGFISKENFSFAWEALKRMIDVGHRPKTHYFHSVLNGLLKKDGCVNEAADLVSVMLERKIYQNIDVSTDVIHKIFENGLSERAFGVIKLIYANGYYVKMEKIVFALCEERKFMEAQGLLLFSLEKKENFVPQVLCMVVNGLCEIEKVSEAFDLFYKFLDEIGSGGISSCMNPLLLSLKRTGMLKEAEFVSKQIIKTNVGEKHIVR